MGVGGCVGGCLRNSWRDCLTNFLLSRVVSISRQAMKVVYDLGLHVRETANAGLVMRKIHHPVR